MDGKWHYSLDHGQLCQVIETQTRWGEPTCRVWLPGRNSVVRSPASRLKPLESAGTSSPDEIAYIAAAARVADALTQDVLLAPIESSVIPLPFPGRAEDPRPCHAAFPFCAWPADPYCLDAKPFRGNPGILVPVADRHRHHGMEPSKDHASLPG
ncbi:MAG: hypothetical protein WCO14_05160 [bacterium]